MPAAPSREFALLWQAGTTAAMFLPFLSSIRERVRELTGRAVRAIASTQVARVRDRALSGVVLLIAIAASVWGALVTLYFDKPFGTWRDYAGLAAWALGTTTALGLVNEVLAKLSPIIQPPGLDAAGGQSSREEEDR